MVRVFLVEDEVIVRDGIKKNIDWSGNGLEFVGEASDGELAFPMIQETKPDILITDIKMPFMDGLELSRLVKEHLPDTKIMILSGYDEFEYAKEAIGIGITEYLLKPISGAKLLEAVKKVADIIEKERNQRMVYEQIEREKLALEQLDRNKFFIRLISEKQSVSLILERARACGIDLLANKYQVILFKIFNDDEKIIYSESQNEKAEKIEQIMTRVSEKYAENVIVIKRNVEGWAFIIKEVGDICLKEIRNKFIEELQILIKTQGDVKFFGGIGCEICRLSEFEKSFETADKAFAYRYFKELNQIVEYEEVVISREDQNNNIRSEQLSLGSLSTKQSDRRIVESFLKSGLRSEVKDFIDTYFAQLDEKNMRSLIFRQYTIMDMYMAAVGMLEQIGYSSKELVEECGEFDAMANGFEDINQTKKYLIKVFTIAIGIREEASQKKYVTLLQEAVDYIKENYDNEEISLNTVAASVKISPNHFSTIFSQQMKQTFIEFLTSVRMEKAKELLRSSTMRTSEIANNVGYKDPHYFSYIFKKTQECTPREFRNKA